MTKKYSGDIVNIVADMRKKGGKKMVNVNKLRGKIVECGLNTSELANLIGIDNWMLPNNSTKLEINIMCNCEIEGVENEKN